MSRMLSNVNLIRATDFNLAWVNAIGFVLTKGVPFVFGKEKKRALDSCQLIELRGNAIGQIERREVHPDFPFQGNRLDSYCNEFTYEYLANYKTWDDDARFDYLYFERMADYKGVIDQLQIMRNGLREQCMGDVSSNYCQAITWEPEIDNGILSTPCLQKIQARYVGNHGVDIHFSWRSRDLWGAAQANLVALIECLNREVVKPNDCKIVRIVDFSDSLHIYENDLDEVRTKIGIDPMLWGR